MHFRQMLNEENKFPLLLRQGAELLKEVEMSTLYGQSEYATHWLYGDKQQIVPDLRELV